MPRSPSQPIRTIVEVPAGSAVGQTPPRMSVFERLLVQHVQTLRFSMKSSISIPDAMAVLGTLVLLKEPMSRLMGTLPRVIRHPCGSQMVLNL